jgi:hypothetical protein
MRAFYIEVSAGVRYWEDATINGQEDTYGTLTPIKRGDRWCPVIRLADGLIADWPLGVVADIHFKVCDDGEYWLLDETKRRIGKWAGYYVPNAFLCHGDTGYGDYIIMKVDAEGFVYDWSEPKIQWLCECDADDQTGWKNLASAEAIAKAEAV